MATLIHSTRSQVFEALFTKIKTIPPPSGTSWKYTSQNLKSWDNVVEANQPALFLHRGPQVTGQGSAFGAAKWLWRVGIWVYYRVDGLGTVSTYPDQLTDQFLDNIELAFQTDPMTGRNDLGGLVHNCWIEGTVFFDSGLTDAQAVIVVPLSILV